MAKVLSLASDSRDARHADVRETAARLVAQLDKGLEVNEVIVIYTTNDGETLNYHAAGGNHFRLLYIVQKLAFYWLRGDG